MLRNRLTQFHSQFQGFPEADIPVPENPTVQKDWHYGITNDLRQNLIVKLVKAIFPLLTPTTIKDQRIKELISYAKKVEKEIFEHANDKEEYYQFLAEKIYKIQKELQKKKDDRLTEKSRIAENASKSSEVNIKREESIKRCIQSLVHASQCRDANCRKTTCLKMRKVVQHTKDCQLRQNSACPVCKQLFALCCYHSKHCSMSNCPVKQ